MVLPPPLAHGGIYAVSIAGLAVLFLTVGKERLPRMTYSDMLVRIDWNDRISAEENGRRTAELVARLGDRIEQSTIMAGVQQFILSHTDQTGIAEAVVYLKCRDAADVEPVQRAIRDDLAAHAPGALCSFGVSGNVFDMIFAEREAPLTARLRATSGRSPDPEALQALIGRIREALPGQTISDAPMQEDLLYVAQPERMALYGIGYTQLVATLRNALNENTLFTIASGDETLPRGAGQQPARPRAPARGDLHHHPRRGGSPAGSHAPDPHARPEADRRGARGQLLPARPGPRAADVPQVMATIRRVVAADEGFEVSFSGSYFSNRGMVRQLIGVLVVALLLLYFILAAQFESLVQPWIILSEIVIDLFGAIAVLWCFGQTLNLMSMIGLVVVCGIVINDSILKIDTINTLRRNGLSLRHAILEAGRRRLKAIVMTSLTTILAVAPFLVRGDMGSDLQFPMSLVIISGMTVGTLVSVLFIPLAYYEIYRPRR